MDEGVGKPLPSAPRGASGCQPRAPRGTMPASGFPLSGFANLNRYKTCPVQAFGYAGTNLEHASGRDLLFALHSASGRRVPGRLQGLGFGTGLWVSGSEPAAARTPQQGSGSRISGFRILGFGKQPGWCARAAAGGVISSSGFRIGRFRISTFDFRVSVFVFRVPGFVVFLGVRVTHRLRRARRRGRREARGVLAKRLRPAQGIGA